MKGQILHFDKNTSQVTSQISWKWEIYPAIYNKNPYIYVSIDDRQFADRKVIDPRCVPVTKQHVLLLSIEFKCGDIGMSRNA